MLICSDGQSTDVYPLSAKRQLGLHGNCLPLLRRLQFWTSPLLHFCIARAAGGGLEFDVTVSVHEVT